MYICPHCNQPGLSVVRRAFLGPALPTKCTSCGQLIGVPWARSAVAVAPFLLGIAGAAAAPEFGTAVVSVVLGAVATFALSFMCVPIEKR